MPKNKKPTHKANITPTLRFTPVGARVHFDREAIPQEKGGIITSAAYQESTRCKILAVGPGCRHVKAGDLVLIPLNCGMLVPSLPGRLCRESEILAIL